MPTYLIKELGLSSSDAFISSTIACVVALVLILPLAALSDRIGRKPLLVGGAIAFAVLAYPLFLLLNSGSTAAAMIAHAGLAAIESVVISVAVVTAVEQFTTRVRYSGMSVGYNVCVALFGGTTPYVMTWLIDTTANPLAPACAVTLAAVVSLGVVMTLRETAARPLAGTP